MAKFEFKGKTYERNYSTNYCKVCGARIVFRLSAKGIPEGSDKANKRQACCRSHSLELQRRKLMETLGKPYTEEIPPDDPLDRFIFS